MSAPAAAGAFAGSLAANIGVVDLDPWPGGAELVVPVSLEHRLHQLVLHPPGGVGRDPEPPVSIGTQKGPLVGIQKGPLSEGGTGLTR